jgi:hypothetical protein
MHCALKSRGRQGGRSWLMLAVNSIGWFACMFAASAVAADEIPRIRIGYFVPSDRQPVANYEQKIRVVMGFVAELYRTDLQGKGFKTEGLTFEGSNGQPTVKLIRGHRSATYYNNAPAYEANEQWRRLNPEIRTGLGNPQRQVIIVFAETHDEGPAPHLWPGVMARGAYNNADGGLAIYTAHILKDGFCALTMEAQKRIFLDETPVQGRRAFGEPPNSARGKFAEHGIGAVAHELGHALGLPHDHREDAADIMGNGFRNLRWNFSNPPPPRRIRFSDENARLLMASRYLAMDLNRGDNQVATVNARLTIKGGAIVISVDASDDTGLRAVVFVDSKAGTVVGGRKLNGRKQTLEHVLPASVVKNGDASVMVIVADDGGNQKRLTIGLDGRAAPRR